ncbi:PREDICTED: group XIIA secretory phospholipase A2-like isoform X2 [Priapulus caudatus]|uniref:Group XIIA secretory phospholipase A2-like isoform X2 n=1 Tax=Priapulus caudatus TaxID=37621 RepID=A0ABM1F198_PRICU|nr:PREDICTED: group XIIA secretory phospholipase A2-like isoform X2 [Priapulus caudatus]
MGYYYRMVTLAFVVLIMFVVSSNSALKKKSLLYDLKKLGEQANSVIKRVGEQVEDAVSTISRGIDNAVSHLDAIGDFIESTEKKTCEVQCQDGSKPVANPTYTPKPNGCGSFGVQVNFLNFPAFSHCCNGHDICYGTCGKERIICDTEFGDCLYDICRQQRIQTEQQDDKITCATTADLMYGGTLTLGCKAYEDAQREACLCKRTEL